MGTTEVRPASRRRLPRLIGDAAAAGFVVSLGAAPLAPGQDAVWAPDLLLANAVAAVVLLARRRAPLPVLAVLVGLTAVSALLGLFNAGSSVAVAIATYAVVVRSSRQVGLIATLVAAGAMVAVALVVGEPAPQHGLAVLLGGAIGEAIRVQRANLTSITERAERAERTREAVARQRVAEDRLGIARDLHDVVAHQIAVINLHAGVASSAVRTRPDDADASLTIIRQASRTVLTEIGDLLAMLRDPRAISTALPGLSQLDELGREFAVHGLEVTVRVDGTLDELPSAVDVTAFRVVQEGLTNAHKHGSDRRAHVLIERMPSMVQVTVTNPARHDKSDGDAPGNRQGLVGMAERVESVRGSLTYGYHGVGAWQVVAALPTGPRGGHHLGAEPR
ncbi:MAG: sensor histidine kinase [Cellulomonadaceae bacterium]|nr:sensor histidine kinase [Cellulomonadaceae bacterium]